MRADQIMDAMGDIDLTLLEECEAYTMECARRRRQLRYAASGICAVLATSIGIQMLPIFSRMTSDSAASEHMKDEAEIQTTASLPTQEEQTSVDTDLLYSGSVSTEDGDEVTIDVLIETNDDILRDEYNDVAEEELAEDAPVEEPANDAAASVENTVSDQNKDKTLSEEESVMGLPLLNPSIASGSFGFEGIHLYDGELPANYNLLDVYGTPQTLPVYKNLAFYDQSGLPVYLDDETMLQMGRTYAEYFGFEVLQYDTKQQWEQEDIPGDMILMDTAEAEIFVEGNGHVSIIFREDVELPDGGSLDDGTDADTAEKTLARLTEQYVDLIGGGIVQRAIHLHRTFDGTPIREHSVFVLSDDARETYRNASFSRLSFVAGEDDGTLRAIHIRNCMESVEAIGEYPLISEETATKYLLEGYYFTSVPAEYLGGEKITEDLILSCELTYHNAQTDEYFIPYYHYYVRLDEFPDDGSVDDALPYGGYWVPAVHPDDLAPDTVWDGRIN